MVKSTHILAGVLLLFSILCSEWRLLYANQYDNEWENINVSNQQEDNNALDDDELNARVEARQLAREQAKDAEALEDVASSRRVRRFHEVLDELLAEFGYDVRMGQLKGLKNLAIRKVDVSESLPRTYRRYVETLVTERIRENSRVRLIDCTECKAKVSRLVEGRLLISSPTTNLERLRLAAEKLGIEYFMDVILVYHTTHMVLGFQIFSAATNELTWSRAYNSETIRSRYQKLAIDYKQVEKSRDSEEYQPEYRYIFALGGGVVPNVSGREEDSGVLVAHVRGTERFDQRRHEFGLHLTTYVRKNAVIKTSGSTSTQSTSSTDASTQTLKPWTYSLALYGLYARHFVNSIESYNTIRHGVNVGIGFLLASGYLTGSLRVGWDIYFGRRFVLGFAAMGVMPSQVDTADNKTIETEGGAGGELVVGFNF